MTTYLPKDVQDDLRAAHLATLKKKSRFRVGVANRRIPILQLKPKGFSVAIEGAEQLRGLVDVYDGARHLYQCLIVAAEEIDGEMHYEFKHSTFSQKSAPLDYARDPDAPVALLR
jgi:hypothetical protein